MNKLEVVALSTSDPTKATKKGLNTGQSYRSQAFASGQTWKYSGYLFYDTTVKGTTSMLWASRGNANTAYIGDLTDISNRYYKGVTTGSPIYATASSFSSFNPMDGNKYLGYYAYNPTPGAYYVVEGK